MKNNTFIVILCALVSLSSLRAEDASENAEPIDQLSEPVSPPQSPEVKEALPEKEEEPVATDLSPSLEAVHSPQGENTHWSPVVGKLLTVGARIDTSFSGGGAIAQGFSIPSLRFSAFGEAGKNVDYRFTMGQTREFSTALLPQLLPTEAFIDLATNPPRDGNDRDGSDLRLRTGMMAPLFNPWWTPDLGKLRVPEYHQTHRALFAFREIGAEIAFRPMGDKLTVAIGAFNGSGIVSLNTNNAKAVSGHVHAAIPVGSVKIGVGNGTYYSEQSSKGAINYKMNWVTDFFAYLEFPYWHALLCVDAFSAHFEDPVRSVTPSGGAVMAIVPVAGWISAFARWETSSDSYSGEKIRNLELGPSVELSDYVRGFFTYQSLTASGSDQRSVQIRLRLTI